ncbi:NAD-dependent epimerase/dehydratase family protein [Akkermansiaceae bacterium]|nr:NAD-dependent epimerase/dehydratase family protein [Akkermansiaceae bacterium]
MVKSNSLAILGYGYLGEAIADSFDMAGWRVSKIGRSGEGVIQADITDEASLIALREQIGMPEVVVHCASSGRGGEDAYRAVFYQGAINIAKVFSESKLIFTSSSSVYPQIEGELVTEESEAEPDRETGKILRNAESIILESGGNVLRLSGIYGEGRSVILKKWLKGESKVEEDGRRMLNQIHRRDAAEAFLRIAQLDIASEIYNVSETHPKSQLETLQWLADHYGKPLPESEPRNPNRKRGWTHKIVSSEKLQSLGWNPQFKTFTDAVESIAPSIELGE